MTRKHIDTLARVALFLTLPVFFYTRPLMPRPLQLMFLAFGLAVIVAEVLRRFVPTGWMNAVLWLPFIAATVGIFPYQTFLMYFDTEHQLLIGAFLALGVAYRFWQVITRQKGYD